MKFFLGITLLLSASLSFAISSSSPVGSGIGVSDFDVTLYKSFKMGNGNPVDKASAISQLSFRDVVLGSSSMLLTINGQKHKFKLQQNIHIEKGYPVASGGSTSPGQTGQGIGVKIRQDYSAYTPTTSTRREYETCYGDRIEVCRDFSHNGYGYECLSDTPTGSETLLVEYSEQRLPAVLTLSAQGSKLAKIEYMTMDFDRTTLQTIEYCDAHLNERETRRELRQRLRERYGNKKRDQGKGRGKGKRGIKRH